MRNYNFTILLHVRPTTMQCYDGPCLNMLTLH